MNVRSMYRACSPTASTRELARYKLDLVGVQQVRWYKGGTVRAGNYIFFMEKETNIITWEQGFFAHHRRASAVKRVEFVSDTESYIILRGCWCNIIVPNVHAPSEEESDVSKDSFMRNFEDFL